jgi:hypothetical protein
MAKKILFQTALTDLETTDLDGLGEVREEGNDAYRWVKNASETALVAAGCCLMDFTTTKTDIYKRVRSEQAAQTGPSTCYPSMPAGSPVTAIAASGASTGDHGWIQVAGIKKVSIRQAATPAQQSPGCYCIGTSVAHTTASDNWQKAYTSVISSSGGQVALRCAQIVSALASTGASTCASAIVQIKCL